MQDWQLLRQYVDDGSQAAFSKLVERHLRPVYSTCLREVCDTQMAEDATQAVFVILARRASVIRDGTPLAGWLFNTSRFVAKNALRQEARRAARERKAAEEMQPVDSVSDEAWREINPVLNDAMASLRQPERDIILLRFYNDLSMAEAGESLGISEDAAKMRVGRALEKLRRCLSKSGVAVSATGFAVLLTAHAAEAVPAASVLSMTAALSTMAIGGIGQFGAGITTITEGAIKAMWMTKLKAATVIVGICAVGGGTVGVVAHSYGTAKRPANIALADRPNVTREPLVAGDDRRDSDGDGLSDYDEVHKYFSDPHKKDTAGQGTSDGGWKERREFTYTITSIIKVLKPVSPTDLNDDYQDVRVIAQDSDSCTLEVVYYPLNTNSEAIGGDLNWKKDDADMSEYLKPTVTANWDGPMRADLLKELALAGIDPNALSDRDLVEAVSRWAMQRGKSNNLFTIWDVDFPQGIPTVLPSLRANFQSGKPDPKLPDQEMFAREVLGKQMFYNKSYGQCTSTAVYLTTILRALGIPTRICIFIPPADPNDPAQVRMLLDAVHHNNINEAIQEGLSGMPKGSFDDHMFNEVYVDHHWVRLNYSTLGQNIVDRNYLGLLTHIYTCRDISEANLAKTWGTRYAEYPAVTPKLSSINPYMLISVSDHFGRYSHLDNPALSALETVTINAVYPKGSPLLPTWISDKQSDFIISIREWINGQDYHQLRKFIGQASHEFTLRASGYPDVRLIINKSKYSSGDGKFQGFGAQFAPGDRDKLVPGINYSIVPINTDTKQIWTVAPGLSVKLSPLSQ